MADIKVLKYSSSAQFLKQNHDEAVDSIKMLSFKTANNELTDVKLGHLIDGSDANDEHIHDARYFQETEFLSSSAGAADAGKPVILDAEGNIDASMINDADIAHDSTDGVAASTAHTAFPLLVGGRDFTAIQSYDTHKTFTQDTEIVDKKYVDDEISTVITLGEWQNSALSVELDSANIVSPSTGDRYLINGTGVNDFAGHDYDIAEWNGTAWEFITPQTGTRIGVDDEDTLLYYFGGTGPWVAKYFESTTASLGCKKVGFDIQADLQASGGLKLNANSLLVEPADFAGAGLIDDGSDNLAIDWSTTFDDAKAVKASDLASVATGFGASIIGIEDSAGNYAATDVEAALAEVYEKAKEGSGVTYSAGTAGVSKGDLVYISSANTVDALTDLTSDVQCVGVALSTAASGVDVKVARFDSKVTGILTSATAGTVYYWDGSAWTATMPSLTGSNIWMLGAAINGTDASLEVRHLRKLA